MTTQPFVLVTGDFVSTGGMDRANYALASYLARNGHAVTLVAHRVAPELAALSGVTVRLVSKPFGAYFLGQWPLARAGRLMGRAGGRVVVNGGNCNFPDVNWVHYVHAAFRPSVQSGAIRRLKAWVERPLNLQAERCALRAARVVVCNSELTRRQVVELCGVDADRAVTVYYGSDPNRFRPAGQCDREALRGRLRWDDSRPVVLFIGGLGDRRKGFDTLFEAWRRLCKASDWNAVLVVIGTGAERPAWERHASSASLGATIQFLGFRPDVPDLLRAADALVAPARYEAYGLGVHEALCCGLPAFVSATAGVAERYPPDLADLLLKDPDDAADLAAKLRQWRDNLFTWRKRVLPLSDFLRSYTWDDMSRHIVQASE